MDRTLPEDELDAPRAGALSVEAPPHESRPTRLGSLLTREGLTEASSRPAAVAAAVAFVAFVMRLPLIATAKNVAPAGDTLEYLFFAGRLQHLRFPGTYRVPGYPALMAILEPLPGSTSAATVVVQHLVGVGVCAILVLAGWRFFGRAVGVLAGLLAALTPVMLGLEHTLQPDFLVGVFFLLGAIGLASVAAGDASTRTQILTGLAFGAATYVKPVGQVLAAATVVALVLGTRSLRRSIRPAVVVLGTMALILLPWIARNAIVYDRVGISDQGGQTLFKRLFDIDRRPIPTDTADGRLIARIQVEQQRAEPGSDLNNFASRALQARGMSPHDAVALEGRVARQAIDADRLGYAARTGPRLAKALTDVNSFTADDLTDEENKSSLRPGTHSPIGLAILAWYWPVRIAAWLWWIASLACLAGLVLVVRGGRTERAAASAIAAVWLAVALATALSHGGMRRYSAELAPLVWLFGSAGAVWLVTTLAALRRRQPPQPAQPGPPTSPVP